MTTVRLTGPESESVATVGSLLANLPELVGSLVKDPRCLVAIAEFADGRYVQFWLDSPARFVAEVISNRNIGEAESLSDGDEEQLRALGWQTPNLIRPNWFWDGSTLADVPSMVKAMARAIVVVLGESSHNEVRVRTFEVSRSRKDSLASNAATERKFEEDPQNNLEGQISLPGTETAPRASHLSSLKRLPNSVSTFR